MLNSIFKHVDNETYSTLEPQSKCLDMQARLDFIQHPFNSKTI